MSKVHNQQTITIRDNPTTFEPINIGSHGFERVFLGRYREADNEPRFSIRYEPDVSHEVTCKPLKISDGTIYILSYQFQSFSDEAVTVTISRCL